MGNSPTRSLTNITGDQFGKWVALARGILADRLRSEPLPGPWRWLHRARAPEVTKSLAGPWRVWGTLRKMALERGSLEEDIDLPGTLPQMKGQLSLTRTATSCFLPANQPLGPGGKSGTICLGSERAMHPGKIEHKPAG